MSMNAYIPKTRQNDEWKQTETKKYIIMKFQNTETKRSYIFPETEMRDEKQEIKDERWEREKQLTYKGSGMSSFGPWTAM